MMEHEISVQVVAFIVLGFIGLNALSYFSKKIKVFPDIIWVLLFGVLYGYLSQHTSFHLPVIVLKESLVFYIFIPLLIFASAQKICLHHFRRVVAPASVLASIGIIISMMIVAIPLSVFFDMPLLIAMLFGVIVSATDPLAISALLASNKKIDENVKLLIEGESILNDGFVVTVFGVLVALIFEGEVFSVAHTSSELGMHIIGSLILGAVLARIYRWLLRYWNEEHFILRVNMTLSLAYGSFLLAESFALSGILAVFAAALAYGYKPAIEDHNVHTRKHIWDYLEYVANICLFFLLGASVSTFLSANYISYFLIGLSIFLVFFSRLTSLLMLYPVVLVESKRLSNNNFWILNFSGARGAVSIALLLLLPDSFAFKELFIALAFFMILFSLVCYPFIIAKLLVKNSN